MSINSSMKKLILQENKEIITPSGYRKNKWSDKCEVFIAIYETDSRVNTSSIRYNESSHIGLTFNKIIMVGNRLKYKGKIYNINGVISQGRISQVFLKEIKNV
ncbi:hypothetical protein JGS6364_09061 [[Clostridium] sordellii]|uniref:hypothetical protein n=1 Tax=Paraclostridium sordellii TaxID=1505 RepID=UPI0005424925|nr:hypothetical protein [Paeniclostridium sordellii]CEK30260.1 hypothetical protein JGS6364_09061 [[Clostridium] sordellii] [Paeniclostridium sordellii]CEK34189.1 hypothetical protein UMC2_14391 [[Clostridium] sordellii] [Paeniclostridium sordellii]